MHTDNSMYTLQAGSVQGFVTQDVHARWLLEYLANTGCDRASSPAHHDLPGGRQKGGVQADEMHVLPLSGPPLSKGTFPIQRERERERERERYKHTDI